MAALSPRSFVSPLRILLIEDDEGDRDLALEYLAEDSRYSYQTTWAQSLEEGLKKIEAAAFDVIILDLVLPDSKGITTVAKLSARAQGIPIIVSSYFDEDALASKAIELGAQDYLAKDLMNSQRLGRIISRALARAKHQLSQQRSGTSQTSEVPAADPLSAKIQRLQADMRRLESIASNVTQVYENQQNVGDVRQRMVKTLSHECRTPATIILLATNILKSYSHNVEDQQYSAAISRIDEAVRQMMKLLDNAMSFKQEQALASKHSHESVNVQALCEMIIAQVQADLRHPNSLSTFAKESAAKESAARGSRFRTRYEGTCQQARVHKAVIEQILRQLIINAAQYSEPRSPIDITIQSNRDQVVIAVQDHGRGIPKEERSRIFEAFYRSSDVDNTHGLGLGLSIVKTCVDICGGQIALESQIDKGSTFTVLLPVE